MSGFASRPRRVPEFDSESERGEFYRNKALSYLELRMRTEAEVRQYLKDWQCPEEMVGDIIDFLQTYRYLDDDAFAEAYLSQERSLNHRSRRDISNRLSQRGLSKEAIQKAFDLEDEQGPGEEDLAQAIVLLQKRIRSGKTDREKNIAFLQRRGFSYQTIRRALEANEIEAPDEQ